MARLQRFYKRPASPTDIRSDTEVVLFASANGRLKLKNYDGEEHTLAYLDEVGNGGGGGGIAFDKPNLGGYLDITTNDMNPSNTGISLRDNSGGGIVLASGAGGDFNIYADDNVDVYAGDNLLLTAANDVQVSSGTFYLSASQPGVGGSGSLGGSIYIESQMTPDAWWKPSIQFRAPNGTFRIETVNYYLQMGLYSPRAAHMTYAEPFGNLQLDANELDLVGNQKIRLISPGVTVENGSDIYLQITPTTIQLNSLGDALFRTYKGLTVENLADQTYNPGKDLNLRSNQNTVFNINKIGSGLQSYIFRFNDGVPVLRIDGDGTYHIKSGATWQADL